MGRSPADKLCACCLSVQGGADAVSSLCRLKTRLFILSWSVSRCLSAAQAPCRWFFIFLFQMAKVVYVLRTHAHTRLTRVLQEKANQNKLKQVQQIASHLAVNPEQTRSHTQSITCQVTNAVKTNSREIFEMFQNRVIEIFHRLRRCEK